MKRVSKWIALCMALTIGLAQLSFQALANEKPEDPIIISSVSQTDSTSEPVRDVVPQEGATGFSPKATDTSASEGGTAESCLPTDVSGPVSTAGDHSDSNPAQTVENPENEIRPMMANNCDLNGITQFGSMDHAVKAQILKDVGGSAVYAGIVGYNPNIGYNKSGFIVLCGVGDCRKHSYVTGLKVDWYDLKPGRH